VGQARPSSGTPVDMPSAVVAAVTTAPDATPASMPAADLLFQPTRPDVAQVPAELPPAPTDPLAGSLSVALAVAERLPDPAGPGPSGASTGPLLAGLGVLTVVPLRRRSRTRRERSEGAAASEPSPVVHVGAIDGEDRAAAGSHAAVAVPGEQWLAPLLRSAACERDRLVGQLAAAWIEIDATQMSLHRLDGTSSARLHRPFTGGTGHLPRVQRMVEADVVWLSPRSGDRGDDVETFERPWS
jgi:hypothetical protein